MRIDFVWLRRVGAIGLLALTVACGDPTPQAGEDGWATLLDDTGLRFWNQVGDANWHMEDDAAVADSSTTNSYLVSKQAYANFELTLEFWVNSEANSGVFLRCQNPEVINETSCYEVNIYDTRSDQTYRTGGIVGRAEPAQFVYTGGQWNRYEISAQGSRLRVTLNGKEMVDVENSELASGVIALQYGTGTVKFRNVRIRSL